jgi:hypothetical protein
VQPSIQLFQYGKTISLEGSESIRVHLRQNLPLSAGQQSLDARVAA